MHVRLWNSPYNGGWIWFDRQQLKRFSVGIRTGLGKLGND